MDKKESQFEVALSASRIKTAQSCSWIYWNKYKQKLPDTNNDGARRGTVCHNVFEFLSKQKTKTHFNKVVKAQDPFASKAVKDLIMSDASELGVTDEELGIPDESYAELDFNIEQNGYHIRGFIDQLFLYKEKKIAIIRDYKTSKKMFEGKEKEDNLQDYMYCLAVKNLFPEYTNRSSEFLFLKFDLNKNGLMKMNPIDDDDLEGFEMQLASIQDYLEHFDEKDAVSNFAADKGFPEDGSFGGKLQCGFAKEKGQLKKMRLR
jgi:ATP-dependent exoDNAse (exonuclease V) beta subunit